jgi:hypothetical protein
MASIDRRAFLSLTALLARFPRLRAFAVPAVSQTAISLDQFVRLSERLTARSQLDTDVSAVYLDALLAVPANGPTLAQLARVAAGGASLTAAEQELERTIIEWWYTGTYTIKDDRRLATHAGALMWTAIGVPAPGTCESAFGTWSRAARASAMKR